MSSDLGSAVYSQCVWRNPFITLSFIFLIFKIKPCSQEKNEEHGCENHKHRICQPDDWEMSDKEESSIRGRQGGARWNADTGKDFGHENRPN